MQILKLVYFSIVRVYHPSIGSLPKGTEVNLLWSTGNVALDRYIMLTMNYDCLIQIAGPGKGLCGIIAEANSACSCPVVPALTSQWLRFLQQPKIQ